MNHLELTRYIEILGNRYKITYHEHGRLVEIQQRAKYGFLKSLFKDNIWYWKRIYFGSIEPFQEVVKLYNTGAKIN
jgi:YD repeat-containing protein